MEKYHALEIGNFDNYKNIFCFKYKFAYALIGLFIQLNQPQSNLVIWIFTFLLRDIIFEQFLHNYIVVFAYNHASVTVRTCSKGSYVPSLTARKRLFAIMLHKA